MAARPNLTEQHRLAQMALRADVLRQLVVLWQAFDPERIDETWASLEPVLMLLIATSRQRSQLLAATYYEAIRTQAGVKLPLPTALPPAHAWELAAVVSLRVTGPVYTRSAIARGQPDLKADALVRVAGAVTRHVLNGGRETLARYGLAE